MDPLSKYQIGQTIYKTCINVPDDETEMFYPDLIERAEFKILGISRFYIVLDNPEFDKISLIREDPIDVIKVSTTGGYFVSLYSTTAPTTQTLEDMFDKLESKAYQDQGRVKRAIDKIWEEVMEQ